MEKPQKNVTVGIVSVDKTDRIIRVNGDYNDIKELYNYGYFVNHFSHWSLTVDARYDFVDVLKYIRSL